MPRFSIVQTVRSTDAGQGTISQLSRPAIQVVNQGQFKQDSETESSEEH